VDCGSCRGNSGTSLARTTSSWSLRSFAFALSSSTTAGSCSPFCLQATNDRPHLSSDSAVNETMKEIYGRNEVSRSLAAVSVSRHQCNTQGCNGEQVSTSIFELRHRLVTTPTPTAVTPVPKALDVLLFRAARPQCAGTGTLCSRRGASSAVALGASCIVLFPARCTPLSKSIRNARLLSNPSTGWPLRTTFRKLAACLMKGGPPDQT